MLPLFQHPSMCIYLSESFLLQFVVFHRSLFYETLVQKLCDICSSISYVLNCSCPAGYFYLWPCRLPPFADCWRRNHSYYSKRRFFFHFLPLKLFWSHRHRRWYLLHKKATKSLDFVAFMVDLNGIGPSTSALRTRRSPKWSAKRAFSVVLKIGVFRAGMRTTQRKKRTRFATSFYDPSSALHFIPDWQ